MDKIDDSTPTYKQITLPWEHVRKAGWSEKWSETYISEPFGYRSSFTVAKKNLDEL
jgi:hypothetical protein